MIFFSNCFEPNPYTILDEKICMFTLKSCSAQFGLVIFCMKNLVKTTSNFKSPQEDENCREIIEQFTIFVPNFLRCMLSFWSNKKTMDSRQCKTIMKSVRSFK